MNLKDLAVFDSSDNSIDYIFRLSARLSTTVKHPGLVILIDDKGFLEGLVTDGDFRKAYSKDLDFNLPVSQIMNRDPIVINDSLTKEELIKKVYEKIELSSKSTGWLRNIVIVDENKKVVDIVDFYELIKDFEKTEYQVKIYGMGYVGLTLAASLSSKNHTVIGLDINNEIIKNLNKCEPHMYEPGLKETLSNCKKNKKISFSHDFDYSTANVYIVAVGTPLDAEARPDLGPIKSSLSSIGKNLKKRDLVILRSTVPAGTTRKIAVPLLEELSNLRAGEEFFISFAPERTIEGNALKELRELPQVIGGLTKKCAQKASEFWSTLSGSVVQVSSLEAAELVKLANNTYRDLSFAFANEVAIKADKFNINAFDLIKAANDGYPRNKISLPSPGVGGYCLTKDPILFGSNPNGLASEITLGNYGRLVNEKAGLYPIKVLERFSKKIDKSFIQMNVLLIGLAFKGTPDTEDMRGSISLEIFSYLKSKVHEIACWDAVIDMKTLADNYLNPISKIDRNIERFDAIFILNNNPKNIKFSPLNKKIKYRLIFDGWDLLDSSEIEKVEGQTYATMGYMSI